MLRPTSFAIPLIVPLAALLSAPTAARAQNFPAPPNYPITVQRGFFGHNAVPMYSAHHVTSNFLGGLHVNNSVASSYLSRGYGTSSRRGGYGGMGRGMRGGGRSAARISSGGAPAAMGGAGAAALMGGPPAR